MFSPAAIGHQQLRVEHDNTGSGPAWHLKQVVVTSKALRSPIIFLCNQWLRAGQLSCEMKPMKKRPGRGTAVYKVKLYTGSARGAGTDANVALQVVMPVARSREQQTRKQVAVAANAKHQTSAVALGH